MKKGFLFRSLALMVLMIVINSGNAWADGVMNDRIVVNTTTYPEGCTLEAGKTYTAALYEGNGGAVYVEDGGNLTGENVTFADNSAKSGGAIYNGKGGKVSLGNATFSGNKVTGEGAKGGAIYNLGTVNMSNTVTLATATDSVYNKGMLNWDLTGETTGKLVGYQYLRNDTVAANSDTLMVLTVKADQALGDYVIATGDFDMAKLTANNSTKFYIVTGTDSTAITVDGEMVAHSDLGYKLAIIESAEAGADQLVLTAVAAELGKDYVVNSAWVCKKYGDAIFIEKDSVTYIYTFGETAFSNITGEGGVLTLKTKFKAGKIITLYSDLLDETGDFHIDKAYQVNLNGFDYTTTGKVYDSITIRNSTTFSNTFTGGTLITADYGYFSVNGINKAIFDKVENAGGTVYLYTTAQLQTDDWVNYEDGAKRGGRGEVYVFCPDENEEKKPVLTDCYYKVIDQNNSTTLTISNYGWIGNDQGTVPEDDNYLWFYSKNHWEEPLPTGYYWATEEGDLVIKKTGVDKLTANEMVDKITVETSGESYYNKSINTAKDVEITAHNNSTELKLTGDVSGKDVTITNKGKSLHITGDVSGKDVTITDNGKSLHITGDVTSTGTTTIETAGNSDATTVTFDRNVSGKDIVIKNQKTSGNAEVSVCSLIATDNISVTNSGSDTLTVTMRDFTISSGTGSLTMNYASQISFSGTWTNNGTTTVDMTNATADTCKLIVYTGATPKTLESYGTINLLIDGKATTMYKVVCINNNLLAVKTYPEIEVTTTVGKWFKKGDVVTISGTYKNYSGMAVKSIKVTGLTPEADATFDTQSTAEDDTWSYTYTGPNTKGTELTFTITDGNDLTNLEPETYTLKVDTVSPAIDLTITDGYKAEGSDKTWYKKDAEVSYSAAATDTTSGVKEMMLEGVAYTANTQKTLDTSVEILLDTITFSATDIAGNDSTQHYKYGVDGNAPTRKQWMFKSEKNENTLNTLTPDEATNVNEIVNVTNKYPYQTSNNKVYWFNHQDETMEFRADIVDLYDAAVTDVNGAGLNTDVAKTYFAVPLEASTEYMTLTKFQDDSCYTKLSQFRTTDGMYDCTLKLTDNVGNDITTTGYLFGYDGTAPELRTNYSYKVFNATDEHSGVSVIQYSLDNGTTWLDYAEVDSAYLMNLSVAVGAEKATFLMRAVDRVGNASEPISYYVKERNIIRTADHCLIWAPIDNEGYVAFYSKLEVGDPDAIKTIDQNIYNGKDVSSNIKRVELPEEVVEIGDYAFYGCSNIIEVFSFNELQAAKAYFYTFKGVNQDAVFYGEYDQSEGYDATPYTAWFAHIRPVTPPADQIWYKSTDRTQIHVGLTDNMRVKEVGNSYGRTVGKIYFDGDLERVGVAAFKEVAKLRDIYLPEGLTFIGQDAFRGCTDLKRVTTPDFKEAGMSIHANAFEGCPELDMVRVGENTEEINAFAFAYCDKLEEITLPKTLKSIYGNAFSYNKNLKEVNIQAESMEHIWLESFEKCHEDLAIYVPADNILFYEGIRAAKGLNFQTRFDVTMNGAGKATVYFHHHMILPAGLTATAYKYNGGFQTSGSCDIEGTVLAGGQGYVLEGNAGKTYRFVTVSDGATAILESHLTGVLTKTTAGSLMESGSLYVHDGSNFVQLTSADNDKEIAPRTAIMLVDQSGTPLKFAYDEATGVLNVNADADADGATFNTAGQQINEQYKGIVIKNGKKYLNK